MMWISSQSKATLVLSPNLATIEHMMKLAKPSEKYKKSFLEAVQAHKESGEKDGHLNLHSYEWFDENFESMVQTFLDESEGKNLSDDRVPSTEFWIVDGDQWLGRFSLRHKLNAKLERYGGHLGYYLIPSARKKGIGTWAFSEVLKEARKLGIEKIMVSCDESNIGSQKLIKKFGGTLQDITTIPENDGPLMRWWVSTLSS